MNSKKGKLYVLLVIASILICFSFSACQPTPKNNAVVNKSDSNNAVNNIIASNDNASVANTDNFSTTDEPSSKTEIPKQWEEKIDSNDQMQININAKIEVPENTNYPILQVKPAKFTQQQIDQYLSYFADEKKLFIWPAPEIKSDIEAELINFKRGAEVDGELVPPSPDDPYILELEKRIEAAPSERIRQYIDTTLQPTSNGGNILDAGIEWSNDEDAIFSVENYGNDNLNSTLLFLRGGNILDETTADLNDIVLKDSEISEEEAVEKAQQVLEQLGIKNMAFSSSGRAEMEEMGYLLGMRSGYHSSGYEIIFMPEINGIRCIDTSNGGVYSTITNSESGVESGYTAPWYQEMIMVYVDGEGVQRFSWSGYTQIDSEISASTNILPFSEIKERITKQLYYQNGAIIEYSNEAKLDINVNRVVLGLSLINKKDQPDVGLLVPAWNVFYEKEIVADDVISNEEGFLILNAIDGSVIDPLPASTE